MSYIQLNLLNKKKNFLLSLVLMILLTGCLKDTKESRDKKLTQGCISATALGVNSIEVNFHYPDNATKVTIYRNNSVAAVFFEPTTTFIDSGLAEGTPYQYDCVITQNGKDLLGSQKVSATTPAVNPPTFAGITSVDKLEDQVVVTWAPATGVPTTLYKIYANPGLTAADINFNLEPIAITNGYAANVSLPELSIGDEMTYQYAVRACNVSSVCDNNAITKNLTLDDRGMPTTIGATAVNISNGRAVLSAPWSFPNGAVRYRRVYRSAGGNPFTLLQTFNVVSPYSAPPTSLNLNEVLIENTTYSYYVIDEDPSGNLSDTTSAIVSIDSGDITAPIFLGIESLSPGIPADTSVNIAWTAIDSQPNVASGASHYLIYRQILSLESPLAACTSGTLVGQVPATNYVSGSPVIYSLSGLSERTRYGFCIKARDMAGNISATTAQLDIVTRDLSPPEFNGLVSISYNNEHNRVELTWNPSTSLDIKDYSIKVWKGSQTIPADLEVLAAKPHSTSATGAFFRQSDYPYTDNELIYVIVNACDDAFPNYGNQNCTDFPNTQALSLLIPDITPPAGFTGITAATADPTEEGKVTVTWSAPPSWAEYRGFKVYALESDTNIPSAALKDCPCSANHCPNTITSCVIQGLPAYKTYNLYVAGYDISGNITSYLSPPGSYKRTVRTSDLTPPNFTSNLTIGSGANPLLSWDEASDNQQDSPILKYSVYRKRGSNFVNPKSRPDLDPSPNISVVAYQILATSVIDTDSLIEGNSYYYIACAHDQTGNMSCDDTNIQSVFVDDLSPPIISNLAVKKVDNTERTTKDKLWKIEWVVTDASTSQAQIEVEVYRKISANEYDADVKASTSDPLITSGFGLTSVTNQKGPFGQNRYINYLIRAKDLAGNISESDITVKSANMMSIEYLGRNEGVTSGGKTLLVKGSGFGSGARIRIGSNYCDNNLAHYEFNVLSCSTPPHPVEESVMILIENEDGQTINAGNYIYNNSYICDLAQPPSGMAAGSGTAGDPYIICNDSQLNQLRETNPINYLQSEAYYKLMDHINLASWTSNSFLPIGSESQPFYGRFDGNNMMISNYTYSSPTSNYVGLFANMGRTENANTSIKNLLLSNFLVKGTTNVGLLAGRYATNITSEVKNIHVLNGNLEINTGSKAGFVFGEYYCETSGCSNEVIENIFIHASTLPTSIATILGGFIGTVPRGGKFNNIQAIVELNNNSTANNAQAVGGILGNSIQAISLKNISVKGTIKGSHAIGGLIGNANQGSYSVNNVYINAAITGAYSIGGLIGDRVNNSGAASVYSKIAIYGNIKSLNTSNCGGVIGTMRGTSFSSRLENSYVAATIECVTNKSAGLVGAIDLSAGHSFLIEKNYVYGAISGTTETHSLLGHEAGAGQAVASDNFYHSPGTGHTTSGLSSGASDLNIDQMRDAFSFTNWDFTNTWQMPISDKVNNGFPTLRGLDYEWD